MSVDFTKKCLSGAANGLPVKVAAVTTPGTVIHTAVAGITGWDEVWLWAMNTNVSDVLLTVQWGGVASPDNDIIYTVTAKDGLKCIIPGLPLQNGLVVRAYAAVANVIIMHGFANNIT